MSRKRVYKVVFSNRGKVYEIFVRSVAQGELFGFIEVEELLFGERSQVVVDPSEERLKAEFAGVRRSYIPLHAILRIDEVERSGVSRISSSGREGEKVTPFPSPIYTPRGGTKKP